MASASDNFNRADSGTLGANWTDTEAGMSIVTNTARAAGGGSNHNAAYYNATTFTGDHYSEAVITLVSGNIGGVTVRHQAGGDYYVLVCRPGLDETLLQKYVAGVRTTLKAYGVAAVSGRTQRLHVSGTTLKWFENGVQIGTDHTDASLSGGQPGVYGRSDSVVALDDWAAADIGGVSIDLVLPVYQRSGQSRTAVIASGFSPPNK